MCLLLVEAWIYVVFSSFVRRTIWILKGFYAFQKSYVFLWLTLESEWVKTKYLLLVFFQSFALLFLCQMCLLFQFADVPCFHARGPLQN